MIDKSVNKKVIDMKKKLLKKDHTHAGKTYTVGTPLGNLKATDTDIEYMVKVGVV